MIAVLRKSQLASCGRVCARWVPRPVQVPQKLDLRILQSYPDKSLNVRLMW
jgi:hypothetical protein